MKEMTSAETWITAARARPDKRSVQQAGFTVPTSRAAAEFTTAYQQAATRVLQGAQPAADSLRQAQAEAVEALGP